MSKKKIPKEVLSLLQAVKAKRPKTVIDHIVKHGFITSEELQQKYGYHHPPRAVRDVREQGIPLETFKVKDSAGRSIAAYRFAKWEDFRSDTLKGRFAFSKKFKNELVATYGRRCSVCSARFEDRYLQIDHRVPYEISGDDASPERDAGDYMLLCSSCNRAKSWSCEHCPNRVGGHDPSICLHCYWASPTEYRHIATQDIRRLALVWQENEVGEYDAVKKMADETEDEMPVFIKNLLRKTIRK